MRTDNHRPSARRWTVGMAVMLVGSLLMGQAGAQEWDPTELPGTEQPAGFTEITPELRESVDQGLEWLASTQNEDGSFGANRYGRNVAITSLASMAFMADGHLPGRGEYGDVVEAGLSFVLDSAAESGLITQDTSHGPMYCHGFATLFLGEIYGMTGDPRVREALLKAVRLIVNSQNEDGGWRYQPVPFDADVSVTIVQVAGLRSARNAGLSVPRDTIDQAIAYVKACQNSNDGGFLYMQTSGGSAFPRSAAGVATLFYAGIYDGEEIERGMDYLEETAAGMSHGSGGHYFYGQYYASQAMFLAGGEYWENWFPALRTRLLENQRDDGRWSSSHGDSYATSMALLSLQVPNRLLPIFQR